MMRPAFPEITPDEALIALAAPDAPALLDIRLPEDVATHPGQLPAAHAIAHTDRAAQIAAATGRGAIVICHKGQKLSAGVTARLSASGIKAARLTGGHVGWADAGLPVIADTAPRPERLVIACDAGLDALWAAWSLKRFRVPEAEVIEVPEADLPGVALRFDAHIATLDDLPRDFALCHPGPLATLLPGARTWAEAFALFDLAFRAELHETVTGQPRRAPLGAEA